MELPMLEWSALKARLIDLQEGREEVVLKGVRLVKGEALNAILIDGEAEQEGLGKVHVRDGAVVHAPSLLMA